MTDPALHLIDADRPEKWQQILADLITDPKELLEILQLDAHEQPLGETALQQFSLKVPRPFAARMEAGNWNDPLLKQVWPAALEEQRIAGLVQDPLREQSFNPAPGILQKYSGRALLTAAPHCAIHCRYCFRRHFDYQGNAPDRQQWRRSLTHLRNDADIREVILSGGDPLANSDRQLAWLIEELGRIPHLTTLRIHTRLPVVIPQRVTPALRGLLQTTRLQVVLVIHCNHARELDDEVLAALNTIAADGRHLLNQSVLLAGINDSVPALHDLSQRLFQAHVLPYYLHLPDRVAGTGHFQVTEARGLELIRALRARLPGYLVPRLVREDPGSEAKTLLA